MERRKYLQSCGIVGATLIAGCSGDGGGDDDSDGDTPGGDGETETQPDDDSDESTPTDESTPREASAVVGDLIEGSNLAMVARDVSEADQLGQFTEPDEGNVFVVVRMAVKNTTNSEFADFNSLLQTRLLDDQDYTYDQSIVASTDRPMQAGQLAPGEVVRGDVVFEVPEDASGLQLEFDFQYFDFSDFERVTVDLTETAGSIADLDQDLAVPIHGEGDAVESGGLTAECNGFETATELDDFTQADEGNEYAIVDVSVTNETGEEQSVSILLQMMLKDGEGFSYSFDLGGYSALDQKFEQGTPISDGQTRRGKIAYQVPEGTSPLYWAFEFDVFVGGDKTFWQVR